MSSLTSTLRSMERTVRDLEGGLALSREVRWPYRQQDWDLALGLGEGFVVEDEGQVVACALWWPYGETLATCGIIIVSPAVQGCGIGRLLMDKLLSAAAGRSVLLNSTAEGYRLYKSYGFTEVGTVHQHQAVSSEALSDMPLVGADALVRGAGVEDMSTIRQLDEQAFGAKRTRLIDAFARIGSAAVIEREGMVEGFAICRPFGLGEAIGPVIARSGTDAQALIRYFLRSKAGAFLRVDVTGESGLGGWLAGQGLPDVGSVTTMLRGQRPAPAGPGQIYALASQSFG